MYQYPYGDSQQLNLDWLVSQWQIAKNGIDQSLQAEIDRVETAIADLLNARDQAVAAAASANNDAGDAHTDATNAHTDALAAAGDAASASADALKAEGNAVGEQNGTPVTSGSPYYQNNAKYYANEAATDASDAHNDAIAAAQDAADAHADALAAAGDAASASADALKAEGHAVGEQNGTPVTIGSPYYQNNAKYYANEAATVAASIPADYSLLSETVEAISTTYITDWFDIDNDDMDSIGSATASNLRIPWAHKNRFGAEGQEVTGTTYYSYLITGDTAKYVGSNYNSVIQSLTAQDFIPIEISSAEYRLSISIKYKGRGLRANSHSGGAIIFATYDADTQTVSGAPVFGNFGVTRQGANIYKHVDVEYDIGAYLPEIYTTKNIAIIYQTRYPDVEEEFVIQPHIDWIGWGATRFVGDYGKPLALESATFIATRNYTVNDFVIIGYNLYKITQAISTGETIVPNTNCVYTTIGQELTTILNS